MDPTRDRLLDAAADLVRERGADALSLREVARRAGLSPMAVYRHFEGIDALRDALRDRGFALLLQALAAGLAAADPVSRLIDAGRAYVAFALAHPAYYQLLFSGGPPPEQAFLEAARRRDASSFRFVVDRVREAMDTGGIPAGDPEEHAIYLWGVLHGLVSLQLEGKLKLAPDAFGATCERAIRWTIRPS